MKRNRTAPVISFRGFVANLAIVDVRTETYQGREYYVAPVVMAVETVMNDLFYPAEELAKFVGSWNGRPLTLFHPRGSDGEHISANDTTVPEEVHLGLVRNVTFNDGLRGEAWLDKAKARAVRPEVLEYFEGRRDGLEVSTGLWGDVVAVAGQFNDQPYQGIMTNIRPDHLALLPGGEGACNWATGCGLRANEEEVDVDKLLQFRKEEYLSINAATLKGMMDAMRTAIDQMDDRSFVHYFRDATVGRNAYVIYSKEARYVEGRPMEPAKMYRQPYEVDANGVVTLTGTPEEVVSQTTYVTVSEQTQTNEKENSEMNKKEKVDQLIACQRCRFQEKDRDFLMNMTEEQLELVTPPENVVLANEQKPAEPKVEEPKTETVPKVNTAAEWLAAQQDMPSDLRETMMEGLMQNAVARAELIGKIMKADGNLFTQQQLEGKSTADLKGIAALVGNTEEKPKEEAPTFFGMRLPPVTTNSQQDDKGPEPLTVQDLGEVFRNNQKK